MQSSSILRAAEGHVVIDSVGGWGEAGDAVVIDYAGCWGWGCVIIINSAGGVEGRVQSSLSWCAAGARVGAVVIDSAGGWGERAAGRRFCGRLEQGGAS